MKVPVLNFVPGKVIHYREKPCIVLEHRKDGTLLMSVEQIKHVFGPNNNFAASSLRSHLNSVYLDTLTQGHPDEIITRIVDLTALNGSKEYGTCEAKVAPLTLDELRKYYDIIPKPEMWEWSATPWSTPGADNDHVWVLGVVSDGRLSYGGCASALRSRPAFLISSDFAVEDDSSPLEQYSTRELAEELFRRIDS